MNTNAKQIGVIKGSVQSAIKDALNNVLTSTYITNVTWDSTTNTLSFWSGNTLKYSCKVYVDSVNKPLFFLSKQDGSTITFTNPYSVDVYQTSTDSTNWSDYTSGTSITLNNGDGVYFRVKERVTHAFTNSYYRSFSITGRVEAYNNIDSLMTPDLSNVYFVSYMYIYLFQGCTGLTKAPLLPSMQVPNYGYVHMFDGCTGLTKAPELPATQIFQYAYSSMFTGCTFLVDPPPVLPATSFFSSSSSSYAYRQMFKGCTSLTKAPEILATDLKGYDFEYMFQGCTSLTKAPLLHATTLKSNCYRYMFDGCTSLNEVKIAATSISASNCLNSWLNNVSATGDFYCVNGVSYPSGASGIPSGWNRIDLT